VTVLVAKHSCGLGDLAAITSSPTRSAARTELTIAFVGGRRKMRKERESGSARWFRGTRVANRCVRRCQAALAIQWLWSFKEIVGGCH